MRPEVKTEVDKALKELKKEALSQKTNPKEIEKSLNRLVWVFLKGVSAPMLVRAKNLLDQAKIEIAFDESNVESPEVRKKKLAQYIY